MGDGIMALFGMDGSTHDGARAALRATSQLCEAVEGLNAGHGVDPGEPLRFGIGVHTGKCILGRVGSSRTHRAGDRVTALGDTVNTASRLESFSKELGVEAVISSDTLQAAGISLDRLDLTRAQVRGRSGTIACLGIEQSVQIKTLLEDAPTAQAV